MLNFLLAVHFLLTISIIGLILLQKQDSDGALGSSGGGAASGIFSIRGQANILTRATSTLMAIFMLNCLIMAKMTKTSPKDTGSVINQVAEETKMHGHAPLNAEDQNTDQEPINQNELTQISEKSQTVQNEAQEIKSETQEVPQIEQKEESNSKSVSK